MKTEDIYARLDMEEKYDILLKDLCARLPYSPFVQLMEKFDDEDSEHFREIHNLSTYDIELFNSGEISNIKPYLRPMSSMTEGERKKYELLANRCITNSIGFVHFNARELINWLLRNHFDYNGLIPKGLAIEVTKINNPYEN